MKIYSVFLGFGFMLMAGVSSDLQKCQGKTGLEYCVYFNQNGTSVSGLYCTSGGDGDCGMISTCVPSM